MNLDDQELSRLICQHATRHTAPDALRASIRTQIALQTAARPPNKPSSVWAAWWQALNWRSATAGAVFGMALTVVLSTVVIPKFESQWATPSIEDELVSNHVHSLGMGPLIAVASSDQHTVKPWFQGKIEYAPPVPDLSAEGFPLLGGRVERIGGMAVATLAYARNQHILNVYVWPADHAQTPLTAVHKGFNLQHLSVSAMQIWVVSDLEESEVASFSAAWRGWVISSEKTER